MTKKYKYQKIYKDNKKQKGLKWCRGNRNLQYKRYFGKYPHKLKAQWNLNNAIRAGKIKKPDICSICGKKGLIMGHHHDYSKPLDVIWVCWVCHNKIHNK